MTCPPCTGACNQGRACPARIEEAESVVTFPLTGLNLLLAVATVAAAIGLSYLGSLTS
jgi:hypothetical protein